MIQEEICIISGNSNRPLAESIAKHLGLGLSDAAISRFKDGEIAIEINESIRGRDCFVIQSTSKPANEHLMELLVIIDSLKRASAKRINAVIPYYGYARQDRKAKGREPITAKLVADMLTVAGADRVVTIDLHADQIQGFFNIPVDHLSGMQKLADYFEEKIQDPEEFIVVSPDLGGVKRARKFAHLLKLNIAIIEKRRPKDNEAEVMNIIGNVNGKNVVLVDDMIDTGGTICNAANALIENGAKKVYGAATHGVLSDNAIQRIQDSKMEEFVITDTIYQPEECLQDKITVLPMGPLIAECIKRIHNNTSVSELFK